MKIALVYLSRRGGGNLYSYEMARALAKKADVLAVVSEQAENINDWRASGLKIMAVDTFHSAWSFIISSLNLIRFMKIRRQILDFGADVIYHPMGHVWTPVIQWLLPGIPHIYTMHDPKSHQGEDSLWVKLVVDQTVARASGIVILSELFREMVKTRGFIDEQILVIPHGEFSHYSKGLATSEKEQGKSLLFFGRISEYKGVGILLEAFAQIASVRPHTKLLLAGAGNLAPYQGLIDKIPPRQIDVVNKWIADDEVKHYFSQVAFVVVPYIDATQSGVIPVAYGFGLPVVASRVGGMTEQVTDGVTGFLVEPANVDELVARCLQLIDDPALVRILGENAFRMTKEELSWDRLSGQLLEFMADRVEAF